MLSGVCGAAGSAQEMNLAHFSSGVGHRGKSLTANEESEIGRVCGESLFVNIYGRLL